MHVRCINSTVRDSNKTHSATHTDIYTVMSYEHELKPVHFLLDGHVQSDGQYEVWL